MQTTQTCGAIQIRDIAEARRFFHQDLGFSETRITEDSWQFSLGSNSIVCNLAEQLGKHGKVVHTYSFAPGKMSLVPHCTVTLTLHDWTALLARLRRERLKLVREGDTFFLSDPSGNAIEFKKGNSGDALAGAWQTRTAIKWGAGICALILLSAWLVLT